MKPSQKTINTLFMLILFLSACAPKAEPVIPPTATSTLAPVATATLAPTPTALPPLLVVGGDIPCYAGPGPDFEKLALISIGMKSDLLSKDSNGEYWIIKAPDGSSQCWIESRYSTIIGQAEAIPTLSADAVPTKAPITPTAPKNLTASKYCTYINSILVDRNTRLKNRMLFVKLDWLEGKDETGYRLFKDGLLVKEVEMGNTGLTDQFTVRKGFVGKFVYTLEAFNENGTSPTVEVEVVIHATDCQ
jgi:hypothetical protein